MTVANYIERDLTARIVSGPDLPAELSLPALSAQYGVSFTPVRVALRKLIEAGLVERKSNGRVAVVFRPRKATPADALPQPERSPTFEDVLAEEIIQRSLRGENGFLREEATAERYGIGRTALRQVFGRLAGRGLIEYVPRRGWRVHPFREREMLDYLEIRETLELKALDLAWDRLERPHLERLLAANTPDGRGRPRLDDSLHQYWIDRSGNRYLLDFFARHGPYFFAVFNRAAQDPAVRAQASGEHWQILRALLAGQPDLAGQALGAHIRGQRPKVAALFELLQRNPPTAKPDEPEPKKVRS
jgi:DNA-binding GntR family transcriptional regulator